MGHSFSTYAKLDEPYSWVIIGILTFASSVKQNKFVIIHLVRMQIFPKT